MDDSARRYLEAELAWQEHLRRLARKRKAGRRSGRDALDLARAKRSRLRRAEGISGETGGPGAPQGSATPGAAGGVGGGTKAYVDGSDPTPMAGYTQDQIDALGAKGQALWINGRFAWPVTGRRDLVNLLAAWRKLPPGPTASKVKQWLKKKAIGLRLEGELPASWVPKMPPLHPNEVGRQG
jgi:hypothetical protein